MSLLSDLLEAPKDLSPASKYTLANGLLYLACGLIIMIWPGIAQAVFGESEFSAHEEGLARVIGMLTIVVGWLYAFGGRTGGRQFVAATIVDRICLVPFALGSVAMTGVFPRMLLTFAVLDPALAIGAWLLLRKTRRN